MIENSNKLLDDAIHQINSIDKVDFVFFTGEQIDFSQDFNLKGFLEHTKQKKQT